ncbi:MAG: hypothetical protein WBF36_01945 [Desulfobulbales bacterium]
MPAEYKIDKSRRMVLSVAYGILTDQDVQSHQEMLRDDPDFDSSFSQLVDCTDVTKADDLSTDAIYELARRNPFSVGSHRAFVAPKKLLYGLLRMFQILTNDYPDELVVFKDLTEARKFLKLDS